MDLFALSLDARPWGETVGFARIRTFVFSLRLPATLLPYVVQSFLQRGLHLVGRRPRNDLRSHVVKMLFEPLNFVFVPALKRMRHNLSQITISRHTRRPRFGFELSGILFRQVDCQVHRASFFRLTRSSALVALANGPRGGLGR